MATTVLFHSNTLTARGTEVAMYDYGNYNETLLKNRSIMVFPKAGIASIGMKERFEERFETYFYSSKDELEAIAQNVGAEVCYFIKNGSDDGLLIPGKKNVIHVVFQYYEPHGDVYAYVSEWLSKTYGGGQQPAVPHIIRSPINTRDNLREELGIAPEAKVFGVIGGSDSFKLICATNAVLDIVERHDDKYFVFVKTRMPEWFPWINRRIRKALNSGRLIYLDEITDFDRKERFINSCDAMLHARRRGETFGIALGEFSLRGKPVIVHHNPKTKDQGHYEILGQSANYYTSRKTLRNILESDPHSLNVSREYEKFLPETVMAQFDQVFLG